MVELTGMEEDVITMQDAFKFRIVGADERGANASAMEPTGLR